MPVLLAVMCGIRRGGDHRTQVAKRRSRRQEHRGCRERRSQTKAVVFGSRSRNQGRQRTVSLSSTVVAELRSHKARQAEEQLRLGVRLGADSFVVAQVDGLPDTAHQPDRRMEEAAPRAPACPGFVFTTCGTRMPANCWQPASTPRSPASDLVTPRSASHWTCIRTSCRECRPTRPSALTRRLGGRQNPFGSKMVATGCFRCFERNQIIQPFQCARTDAEPLAQRSLIPASRNSALPSPPSIGEGWRPSTRQPGTP